jgi:hypothetical protein
MFSAFNTLYLSIKTLFSSFKCSEPILKVFTELHFILQNLISVKQIETGKLVRFALVILQRIDTEHVYL